MPVFMANGFPRFPGSVISLTRELANANSRATRLV